MHDAEPVMGGPVGKATACFTGAPEVLILAREVLPRPITHRRQCWLVGVLHTNHLNNHHAIWWFQNIIIQ